jgi:hypothetical protein
MFQKIKDFFHTPNTFLNNGIHERSTWIAIGLLIFGFMFKNDIYILIHNCLDNSRTTDLLITSLPVIISFILAWIKEKK